MKKKIAERTALILLLLLSASCLALFGTGCRRHSGTTGPATPSLRSLRVKPADATITAGATQQFTATGAYSDGTSAVLTSGVYWTSSDTAAATIDAAGLATGKAANGTATATITATLEGISDSASLTVTAASAALQSITISPASASLAAGLTRQFTAKGTYSDGTTVPLSANVVWQSDTPSAATVDGSGLATAKSPGAANITATFGGITSPAATLTVTNAVLRSVVITPASASIAAGLTKQFGATGTYSDNTTATLTSGIVWTSDAPGIAEIDGNSGLATAKSPGAANITATFGGITSAAATLTVTTAVLQSLAVTPAAPSLAAGLTQQFIAKGTFSDGTTAILTNDATWKSDASGVATIDSSGLATGVSVGSAKITAALGGVTSPAATLTVTDAVLQSVTVTPATASVATGLSKQFTATGTYSNGAVVPLSDNVTWKSGTISVATIDTTGLATGVTQGVATITATYGGQTGSATLTVGITTLSFASLPYTTGSVDTTASYYQLTGLTPGAGYTISLTALTGNADLYVYDNAYFSTWLCSSWNAGTAYESCAAIANGSGELYVKVDGYYAPSGATFTLGATLASAPDITNAILSFTTNLPYPGTLYSNTTASYFKITDLTPNAGYTISLTDLSSDADLHVYRDRYFNNLLCESESYATTDESCVVTADASGALYVKVDGVLSTPPTAFTLRAATAATPSLTDILFFGTSSLPYPGSVGTTESYYKITGLSAGTGYIITLTYLTDDADLYVYADPYFSNWLCDSWNSGTDNEACVAAANASGELYILVDGYYTTSGATFTLDAVPY